MDEEPQQEKAKPLTTQTEVDSEQGAIETDEQATKSHQDEFGSSNPPQVLTKGQVGSRLSPVLIPGDEAPRTLSIEPDISDHIEETELTRDEVNGLLELCTGEMVANNYEITPRRIHALRMRYLFGRHILTQLKGNNAQLEPLRKALSPIDGENSNDPIIKGIVDSIS